jgi:hypothetical protein
LPQARADKKSEKECEPDCPKSQRVHGFVQSKTAYVEIRVIRDSKKREHAPATVSALTVLQKEGKHRATDEQAECEGTWNASSVSWISVIPDFDLA